MHPPPLNPVKAPPVVCPTSVVIDGILLQDKTGGLAQAAAGKVGFENFKKQVGPDGFRMEFHPYPALLTLRQVFAFPGYAGARHYLAPGPRQWFRKRIHNFFWEWPAPGL